MSDDATRTDEAALPEIKPVVERPAPRIDPDLPPSNIHNREAARRLGWRYRASGPQGRGYYDSDGIVADEFGQDLE